MNSLQNFKVHCWIQVSDPPDTAHPARCSFLSLRPPCLVSVQTCGKSNKSTSFSRKLKQRLFVRRCKQRVEYLTWKFKEFWRDDLSCEAALLECGIKKKKYKSKSVQQGTVGSNINFKDFFFSPPCFASVKSLCWQTSKINT